MREDMEVVTIHCDGTLVASLYAHSKNGRRFAVLSSKHLIDAHVDHKNPIAPTVMIDLGKSGER
jgi:hypothetical protein